MIKQHLISEALDLAASRRWTHPDSPGTANVKELGERLSSPGQYGQFRATPEGNFLLALIESYEAALNADWMPFEIFDLPLQQARFFIGLVATELKTNELSPAVSKLKAALAQLAKDR